MKTAALMIVLTIINIVVVLGNLAQHNVAAPQEAPEVIRAHTIELLDAQGAVRAQLNVEESGEVIFRMRDQSGNIRVKLGASADGSGLVLMNAATEPGVHILAKREGTSLALIETDQRRVWTPR